MKSGYEVEISVVRPSSVSIIHSAAADLLWSGDLDSDEHGAFCALPEG